MTDFECKLLVIGAGPGGYVAAIRAGQFGVDTMIVEAKAPGGTCLNVGCIPSKALIHAADEFEKVSGYAHQSRIGISSGKPSIDIAETVRWKDGIVSKLTGGVSGLLQKNKVRAIEGWATFIDGKTVSIDTADGARTVRAQNIIIATGSVPVELPNLPFGGNVMSSTEALSLSSVPKKLAVVGAGYIGLELGIAMAKFGSKVTIVEAADRILPGYDTDLTKPIATRLKELGVGLHLNAKALGKAKGSLKVELDSKEEILVEADAILVTVGRKPLIEGWGIEELVLDRAGPFIKIDDKCQTSMKGVYAIGDVTGDPMLAHRAMAQGEMVAEIIAGKNRVWDKRAIPAICFTDPEIVSAGMTPSDAEQSGREVTTSIFPFAANGRAMTMEAETGFVRIISEKNSHVVLGIQAVGGGVSELAASFGLAIEMGARLEDIAGTIHAHPTQGEAFQEAALRSLGHALHI